jgi:hypothetical protein
MTPLIITSEAAAIGIGIGIGSCSIGIGIAPLTLRLILALPVEANQRLKITKNFERSSSCKFFNPAPY